jgi:predicted  nucleic acid-binding Zn-ribbon protein
MRLKGSVTVFVSIILSVLIAFSGTMVDLSRLQTGKKHAKAAVQLSLQSALTRYHAPLKEQYGIMATNQKNEELELLIFELLEKNLAVENRYTPGLIDLYGFEVDSIRVIPCFNMSEDYVLEQQITQFMKYRAPVNTIGNFVEKLKALNTFMKQSGLLNKKMDLEKKLQKIREEQVYLSLLLSERINGFLAEQKQNGDIAKNIKSINENMQSIKSKEAAGGQYEIALKAMPELTEKIITVKNQIDEIKTSLSSYEEQLDILEENYDDIEELSEKNNKDLDKLNKKVTDTEKSIFKEKEKEKPNEEKIQDMETEIEALKKEIESCKELDDGYKDAMQLESDKISKTEQKIFEKNKEIKDCEKEVSKELERLNDKVTTCLSALKDIKNKTEEIYNHVLNIETIVVKYTRYHEGALALADEIEKGAKAAKGHIDDINAEIAKQREKSDNSFLMRIKADIEKLVLNADSIVINDIKEKSNTNLTGLQDIQNTIEKTIETMMNQLSSIDLMIEKVEAVPKTCIVPQKQDFADDIEGRVKLTENHFHEITGKYNEPSYSIDPKINKKEKNEFYKWCNKFFNESNNVDNSKDKGQQKKLKQNIETSDKENKEDKEAYNGEDKNLSDKEINEVFARLPSFKDKDGNYVNVKQSEFSEEEMQVEQNLLEDQASNKSDVEEKYGDLLNQNGSFSEKIGQIISDSSEALINSLYVNEFIVGAFKNANIDKVAGPKIRPTSFTNETFYEKAEVEYIIFGSKREKANANLSGASIFGIRMGLNIIHVYTNPDKTATALTAATALAGWSGFAVPLVKNLILIGWAAGESWLDIRDINAGKPVPIYKTKNTWKLDLKSLFSNVAGQFLDESSDWFKQKKDDLISEGDDALQAIVNDMVSSVVQEAFVPLELAITELGDSVDNIADPTIQGLGNINEFSDFEGLKEWIIQIAQNQYESIKDEGANWTKLKLEEYKKKITEKISSFIFESSAYKNFVSKIKDGCDSIIDKGTEQLADSVKKLGSKIKDTGVTDQIVGTVVSFDYIDYLRLLLLIVPQKTKLLRTADLMQLNMQKSLENPDFCLSEFNSYIIIEADISMKYLFLPLFMKKENKSQIKIRWGYGY